MSLSNKSAVIIGSGNVATRLAFALYNKLNILQVYSRSYDHACELATKIGAQPVNDAKEIISAADIYILAIADDAICKFANKVNISDGLWIHTSGSTALSVIRNLGKEQGVLYPLQTLSKDLEVDFSNVHLLTEASSVLALNTVDEIAKASGCNNVYHVTSEQRKRIHIAAVFGCNFANLMWMYADDILKENGLDLRILDPLLKETLKKALLVGPTQGMTGPARRGDAKIINNHLDMLSGELADTYSLLSKLILKRYHNEQD
ncbi:MAG: DUF2520 domain-containing protein [Muribaculum sp.]|nr:DUF2520 domain-containing protein [Muribaculaceae bacterium]MCM1081052.1 DUF2520 domain-containing protein [Muribaculum sp.]